MGNPPQAMDKAPLGAQKVMWAAAVLALSNIAALLKTVKELFESVKEIEIIIPKQIPFWAFEGIIGIAVLVGNVMLFRFVFDKLKTGLSTGKRILAASVTAVAISLIIVLNVHALSDLRIDPSLTRTRLLTELLGAQQVGQAGGFSVYANNQGTPDDAWTTAQAIKAVLSVSEKIEDKEHLRSAFRYLAAKKVSDGYWNADPGGKQPFMRTEISCWVALAYLESLHKPDFWGPQEWNSAVQETTTVLGSIVRIQNTTGAWAPVIKVDTKFDRTYPTLMAVWALSDAMKTEGLPPNFKASIAGNLERGISWLIQKYRVGYGWDENPQLHIGKKFDGLTFEILLILKDAEDITSHNSFKDTEAYRVIKRDIVNLASEPFSVQDWFAIPTSDQGVDDKQCWATFLAYPWSLAALTALSKDQDIPSSDRRKLNRIRQKELQELNELPGHLKDAETWLVAENLIGLGVVLQENSKR